MPRHSRRTLAESLVAPLLLAGLVVTAQAGPATVPSGFTDTQIVGSLSEPVSLAKVPDASHPTPRVLFVEQRTARVRLIVNGAVQTVGTVPGVESGDNERGLLGIVVDPNWPAAPYFYVHATDNRSGNHIVISRFTLTGDLGFTGNGALSFAPASRYDLIRSLPDNATNHNGGTVRFGPDGYLYVSLGDDATGCPAQDVGFPAGKILRLDVRRLPLGPGGPASYAMICPPGNPYIANPDSDARMVWTSGLRNPFRFHIDPQNGALFVADVGQDTWEEVTRYSAGGQNGGWPWREGSVVYSSCSGSPPQSVAPIATYDHDDGVAIMSTAIYRRPPTGERRFPLEYDGNYFFHDYFSGILRRLVGSDASWSAAPPVAGQPTPTEWATGMDNVSDVLQMPDGSLWYTRQSVNGVANTGEVRRIGYTNTTDAPSAGSSALSFARPQPTPSYGRVTLSWTQPVEAAARLVVYDAGGRLLRVIEDGASLPAGTHARDWDGLDRGGAPVPPGLYFAQLRVGGEIRQARITLLR